MGAEPLQVYASVMQDNRRWEGFPFRQGDVVVSTRSKHGTTWMQQICLSLVHDSPTLPAPLQALSPWLDQRIRPVADVVAALEAQPGRRVIKTHTPLDGVPMDERVTYVVVGRHPLDGAVSLYHQRTNLDRDRLSELLGEPFPELGERPELPEWLLGWMRDESGPPQMTDVPLGVLHHITDAWRRSLDPSGPRVLLVHYADLVADLDGEMRRVADALGVEPGESWPDLVDAATFATMRGRAEALAPGEMKSRDAFFRRGRSGSAREVVGDEAVADFEVWCRGHAPAEVVDWLLR